MVKATSRPSQAVRLYQIISQLKKNLLYSAFGYVSHCRHVPSCGQYGVLMIEKHGTIWGTLLALKRVATCW